MGRRRSRSRRAQLISPDPLTRPVPAGSAAAAAPYSAPDATASAAEPHHDEEQDWGNQWKDATASAVAQVMTPGCKSLPSRPISAEHRAHNAAGYADDLAPYRRAPRALAGTAPAAAGSAADGVAAEIPAHADDTPILPASFIPVASTTTSIPKPPPPPLPRVPAPQAATALLPAEIQAIVNRLPPPPLPTVAAPQAASAHLPSEIQAIVDSLKEKIGVLVAQHAAIREQAAPIVAEKRQIELEVVALEQRRRAVHKIVADFGLQQQKVVEDLKKAQQALADMTAAETMWSGAAAIALAL